MAEVLGYVLMAVEAQRVAEVVEGLEQIEGVRQSHAVTGQYDVIAQVASEDFVALANNVLTKIRLIEGIHSTETAIVIPEPRREL